VLGSHDVELIGRVEADARVRELGRDAFEIAMLYGIRSKDQVRLTRDGFRVRTLISYGDYWFPWFMRRIAEKPVENVLLALRNLFGR
jgi:proline dehydrogenase